MGLIPTIPASIFDSLDRDNPWFYFRNNCVKIAEDMHIFDSSNGYYNPAAIAAKYADAVTRELEKYSAKLIGDTDTAKIEFDNIEGYVAFILTWH